MNNIEVYDNMNINIHLGDNKDCTVSIDTTPEWHLKIQLEHITNYYHNLGHNFRINMCYSMKNIYGFKYIITCHEDYYNICTFVKDIERIKCLIHYMQNNINSNMYILSTSVYRDNNWWIHSNYTGDLGNNSFTIWLCDKSKNGFIKELKGLIHILQTIEQKQVINKCIDVKHVLN